MQRDTLPLESLPSWCLLNDVTFAHCKVGQTEKRGLGLIAEHELDSAPDSTNPLSVLSIPRDLVLSAEAVEGFAKENKDFRQLLSVAGHQSHREDILLFLLMQRVLSSPDVLGKRGASTPWSQYFSLLPQHVPVPTMWADTERAQLRGTSLESAVSAKLATLAKEFDAIRAKVADISLWNELLSVDEKITVQDWVHLDALFRSRSLELPRSGVAMVPCLDQANHATNNNAYYEENTAGDVSLQLGHGAHVRCGEEITINYGQSKSAAEMLFSYGFVDSDSTVKKLTLPLELADDDPLLKAKLHVFGKKPTLQIDCERDAFSWSAPFVYLMCLNEEDGIEFKVLQETNGSQHLRMFWQDADVTDAPLSISDLARNHDLWPVFELRAITVVLGAVEDQLARLLDCATSALGGAASPETSRLATQLRESEAELLRTAVKSLEDSRDALLQDDTVVSYLLAMQNAEGGEPESVEEEDFS